MKRIILVAGALLLVLAAPVLASGPLTMSYQGVLTDAGGNLVPDGPYNLTFRIYNVPSAGSALWTEAQAGVVVAKGGFSVILGSIIPLDLPFDAPYYLGIQIGATAELTPRVPLAASPYAMSVWVPGAGSAPVNAELSSYPGGVYGDGGGYLHLQSGSGAANIALEPRFVPGGGAWMYLAGGLSSIMRWDGSGSAGAGSLLLSGPASSSAFHTGLTGDASVQLPLNAVSSGEILDEPGVAQSHANGNVTFGGGSSASTVDILSVSITIPAPGYIVLTADAQVGLFAASATAGVQITNASTAAQDDNHYFYVGGTSASSGTVTPAYVPTSIHRTYYEAAAGTYTFYFQGWNAGNGASAYAWDPTLTALYTPTSYGTVATSPPAAELSQFDRVTPTSSAGNGPGQPAVSGSLVDLRDLELRVARQKAALEASQRQLLEAQAQQQQGLQAKPVPAAGK